MNYLSFSSTFSVFLFLQTATCTVLNEFLNDATKCEFHCDEAYSNNADFEKACAEGCRLFKLIRLAKGLSSNNRTVGLCFSACTEAYINESSAKACSYGCQQYVAAKSEDETQTIHLLTPLFYMKSAYNTMAHHVRQFISASWTVYVQEDAGKMVVLQSSPKVYESMEYFPEPQMASSLLGYEESCEQGKLYCKSGECLDIERFCDGILDCADGSDEQCTPVKERSSYAKNHQSPWQEEKLDWMDCISHQSGIPRWCLVIVLFGFILALLWLCCATAVTAPNHYLSSKKKNVSYVLLCEPNPNDLKPPPPLINCDEEAPPLPPKVSLI